MVEPYLPDWSEVQPRICLACLALTLEVWIEGRLPLTSFRS